MVLEIPPADQGSITGSIDDAWQCAIADVGPAGTDAGTGGKYLILPPDHRGPVRDGYLPMPSPTYCGYALLRSNLKSGSDSDIAKAVAYGRRVEFRRRDQIAKGVGTAFVDASDVLFDATISYDDARWALPAPPDFVEAITSGFENPESYPIDELGVAYSFAFFSAKQLGTGQFYLMTIEDRDGEAFDGAATYRLAVPPSHRTGRSPTGFRLGRTRGSKSCAASTVRRSRSSTRRGACPMSNACAEG